MTCESFMKCQVLFSRKIVKKIRMLPDMILFSALRVNNNC